MRIPFPFTAIVGQEQLKLGLLLNAVDPTIGGMLIRGEKGTAKSTAVRALAALLPEVEVVADCPFVCDPLAPDAACPAGPHDGAELVLRPTRLVELPVGATEDRVGGSIDLERALAAGARAFEPGLLAAAHRGILYVDEVNLLADHLVDLLLDAAAMGTNHVEREGVSVHHAARFLLVGTMNPEEGELRPQLLDRFGLTVEITAPPGRELRAEVVRRRLAYETDLADFVSRFAADDTEVAKRVLAARELLAQVKLPDRELDRVVAVCAAFEVDGLRADIVMAKTARAVAAWEGRTRVDRDDVRRAALLTLPHRCRRQPFEDPGIDEDMLDRVLDGDETPQPPPDPTSPNGRPTSEPAVETHIRGGAGAGRPERSGSSHCEGQPAGRAPDGRPEQVDEPGRVPGEAPTHSPDRPPGDTRQGDGPAPERVFAAGKVFRPALLTVPGVGAGAWGRRSPTRADHGRPVGARQDAELRRGRFALVATVRAAAPRQTARGRTPGAPLKIRTDDLRGTVRQGREGNLIIFVLDASGSMGAQRRMVAVKGAVRSLLRDAYQRRDKVALVAFRGEGAELVLPPTTSVELADRRLHVLPTGGRTPLAAGLVRAGEVVAAEAVRDPQRRPLLVVLTDGRANSASGSASRAGRAGAGRDPLGEAQRVARTLAVRRVAAAVVDTEEGYVRLGLAAELARMLRAPCLRLEELAAPQLAHAVRGLRAAC